MTRVAIDRTENDPEIFCEILDEFEGRKSKPLPAQRDPKTGRFTKKEKDRD